MRECSACKYEVRPEQNFCANCGVRYDPVSPGTGPRTVAAVAVDDQSAAAGSTGFHNPAVEVVTAQLDQANQQPQATQKPRVPPLPEPEHREYGKPPPGIVLKTFGGGAGNILLGISLIGGIHNGGAIVFGVLFIILGVTTWILGGFGRRPWDKMSPASRRIAGAGAVVGMLFLYVLFFWFVILRWVWRYIINPGLRS